MGKGTQPPNCKSCGEPHWGTCLNHEAKGAIFDQRPSAITDGVIDATYRTKPSASVEGPRTTQVVNVGAGGRTKSTAARKDVPEAQNEGRRLAKLVKAPRDTTLREIVGSNPTPGTEAGTQAPSVDQSGAAELRTSDPLRSVAATREDAGTAAPERLEAAKTALAEVTARGTPRKRAPKGTFDRAAYQREAARKRRAKQKAEKGKTE